MYTTTIGYMFKIEREKEKKRKDKIDIRVSYIKIYNIKDKIELIHLK